MKMIAAVQLLRLLSTRADDAMTVAQIMDAWSGRYGECVNVRSMQRYLSELSADGADGPAMVEVIDDVRGRRYYLRLSEVSQWFMTEEAALGLLLARQVLERSFGRLDDAEAARRKDIAEALVASSQRARTLRACLRVVPDGIGRLAAHIGVGALATTMDALADRKQLEFVYTNKAGDESTKVCSPLALVAKDGTMYLLAVRSAADRPLHYAMHRMGAARVLPRQAQHPPDFELDDYIDRSHQLSHVLDQGEPLQLVLRASPDALFHFQERRLSQDQDIALPDPVSGWSQVTATVPKTMLLMPFLVSIGGIEVLAPPEIRQQVATWHRTAAQCYAGDREQPV